jgi:hypothetical protein
MRRAVGIAACVATLALGVGVMPAAQAKSAKSGAHASAAALPRLWADIAFFVRPVQPIRLSGTSTAYFAGTGGLTFVGTRLRSFAIHWVSWTTTAATGTGDLYLRSCTGSCGSDGFHTYRGSVRGYDPVNSSHGRIFSRLQVTWQQSGRSHKQVFTYSAPAGGWS